jgi:FKBP-type peptidyl-prolyl cis-trans isomerase FkpA
MRTTVTLLLAALAAAVATAQGPGAPALGPTAVTLKSGLRYEDLRVGKGAEVLATSRVRFTYTGWLSSGRIFDLRVDRARPLDMTLGQGKLVKGMEEGLVGMRVGGKRRLFIPAALAYGDRGAPPSIPPKADLTFEIEVVGVAKGS